MLSVKTNPSVGTLRNTYDTKTLVNLALLSAVSFLSLLIIRIPVFDFLSYEAKDIFITLAGFLYGPLATVMMSVVVSLVEMLTISSTGIIGCVMNIISTVAFAGTAAVIYKRFRTIRGAAAGLAAGVVMMTALMLLWNYLITPLYMGIPRAAVKEMLVPMFLPFNLLKASLNGAFTMLCYKPFVKLLRLAGLNPRREEAVATPKRKIGFSMLVSCFVILSCVYFILVIRGIL